MQAKGAILESSAGCCQKKTPVCSFANCSLCCGKIKHKLLLMCLSPKNQPASAITLDLRFRISPGAVKTEVRLASRQKKAKGMSRRAATRKGRGILWMDKVHVAPVGIGDLSLTSQKRIILCTTKMAFPKSLKCRNSGSESPCIELSRSQVVRSGFYSSVGFLL